MHYYKRNLGDYAKKAGRLSMLQHGAYTLLIDSCYDREEFPTVEDAIDWTWASSKEEIEAVEFVLKKFFELQEDGRYVQNRIKQELEDYKSKAIKNKEIAEQREAKRRENKTNRKEFNNETCTNREQGVNETPPNHKPITNNQEPLTNNQLYGKEAKASKAKPSSVEEVESYMVERNASNAKQQAEKFFDHYSANGWKVGGKSAMKDWKAAVRNWLSNNFNGQQSCSNQPNQQNHSAIPQGIKLLNPRALA